MSLAASNPLFPRLKPHLVPSKDRVSDNGSTRFEHVQHLLLHDRSSKIHPRAHSRAPATLLALEAARFQSTSPTANSRLFTRFPGRQNWSVTPQDHPTTRDLSTPAIDRCSMAGKKGQVNAFPLGTRPTSSFLKQRRATQRSINVQSTILTVSRLLWSVQTGRPENRRRRRTGSTIDGLLPASRSYA